MCTHNISLIHDIRDTPNYLSFNITTGAFEHIYIYYMNLTPFFQELYNKQVTGYDHHATMMNMKSYLSRFARFKNFGVPEQVYIKYKHIAYRLYILT